MAADRLILFDTLLQLPEYNKAAVAKALEGRAISTNLAVEKTRLLRKLLGYVSALNESKKPTNNPTNRLNEANIFFRLGLLDEAQEIATKGLDAAVEMELLQLEVQLRDLLRVIYKGIKRQDLTDVATQNEYLLETASKKLARSVRYQIINDRAFNYLRRYRVTDEEGVKKGMEELINLPELRDINMADSLQSQIRFYDTWNYYHASRNELTLAIEASSKSLRLWESNPQRIALKPFEYLSTITNILGKLSITNRLEEAPIYLEKMEAVSVRGIDGEARKFPDVELQYQLYFMNSGKLELALEREKKTLDVLRKYGRRMRVSINLTLMYNLGVAHLLCDNSRNALSYFNRIREQGVLSERQDLQGVARLIRLLLLAENDEGGTFSHYLRNSKRFFQTQHRVYKLEKVVLRWLQTHYKLTEPRHRTASFQKLVDSTTQFVKDGMMGAEEIQIWAFSKANQVSIRLVFKNDLHK